MARPKNNTVPAVTEDVQLAPDLMENAQKLAALQASYSDERDLVNQLLGQAQMSNAFAKFSVTVTTSKLAFVKENKLYQSLKGKKSGNGYQLSGTWDEFCSLLGLSREKADLDISNLNTFGEEALESMSRMGIGYRELRQFRKLPEDEKTALIEVAKQGDKDGFLAIAEELISKHLNEKQELASQAQKAINEAQEISQTLEASRQQVKKLRADKEKLEEHKYKILPPDETKSRLEIQALSYRSTIQQILLGDKQNPACLFTVMEEWKQYAGELEQNDDAVMLEIIRRIRESLDILTHKLNLQSGQRPAWLDEPED